MRPSSPALQDDDEYATERDAMAAEPATPASPSSRTEGIDLTDYHSEASAADLDELRQALGYEQWNVLGVSYGARLALATMRSYPDGVRSVILDSVYDVTAGGLAANCRRRRAGHRPPRRGVRRRRAPAPRPTGTWPPRSSRPGSATTTSRPSSQADLGDGKGPQEFVITGDDMLAGLFNALYDAGLIPLLPSAIDDLAGRRHGASPSSIERGVPFSTGYADAMATAVNCADNAGLDVADDDAAVYDDPRGFGVLVSSLGLCPSGWPPTPGSFNDPVESDIPALVLAGVVRPDHAARRVGGGRRRDWRTPRSSWSSRSATGRPTSTTASPASSWPSSTTRRHLRT